MDACQDGHIPLACAGEWWDMVVWKVVFKSKSSNLYPNAHTRSGECRAVVAISAKRSHDDRWTLANTSMEFDINRPI